jgi:hypothetical protein
MPFSGGSPSPLHRDGPGLGVGFVSVSELKFCDQIRRCSTSMPKGWAANLHQVKGGSGTAVTLGKFWEATLPGAQPARAEVRE